MNKKRIAIIASSLIAASVTSLCVAANAMPLVAIDQCVGLLGSTLAQLPIQDPVVEQTVDSLNKHLQHNNRKLPTIPETTVSRRPRHIDLDGMLILGGSENIPM